MNTGSESARGHQRVIDGQMGFGIINGNRAINRIAPSSHQPPNRHRTVIAAPGKFAAKAKNAGNTGFFDHAPSGDENRHEIKWLRFAINGARTGGRRKRKSMGRKVDMDGSQSGSRWIAKLIWMDRKVHS
ncbi:MAG: hypothetical protein KUL88_09420 [Rhizobium sp.]|nr:hypothetical protein [Rhizobium sp.]